MVRTLHFNSMEGYRKWLAFGHIHNKFHGKAHIMIHGKHHAVVHKTHHEAREIHEYRGERGEHHRVIKLNIGRGTGVMIQGARSSKPYRTGKTRIPNNIWRGVGNMDILGKGSGKRGGLGTGIHLDKIHINL